MHSWYGRWQRLSPCRRRFDLKLSPSYKGTLQYYFPKAFSLKLPNQKDIMHLSIFPWKQCTSSFTYRDSCPHHVSAHNDTVIPVSCTRPSNATLIQRKNVKNFSPLLALGPTNDTGVTFKRSYWSRCTDSYKNDTSARTSMRGTIKRRVYVRQGFGATRCYLPIAIHHVVVLLSNMHAPSNLITSTHLRHVNSGWTLSIFGCRTFHLYKIMQHLLRCQPIRRPSHDERW